MLMGISPAFSSPAFSAPLFVAGDGQSGAVRNAVVLHRSHLRRAILPSVVGFVLNSSVTE